ncbi:hypothetical protein [Shouchella clausii]|uniref:Uncharacterized protein n=1 Tax=Shouchella clausii TaxID=79880 RepID=A0A268RVW8_SHOCL|nr:hypothetical protein [Shouchella clausii]AST97299.1 hypothetical protein BC8716_15590 [Shouchella clausii]MCR1287858.1 hypothetical protein [Shouchella clausii]MCY1106454.1 hypothetical protein [Shouchella clausii]MEB5473204.1 hypothetical protein [Shouchella clausii]PAF24380.1 hypothetical protein CHH61_18980 [Shouchella clausii]
MRQFYRIDNDGYYIEPIVLDAVEKPKGDVYTDPETNLSYELPPNTVIDSFPDGLFRPRFLDGKWSEGATEEEIEEWMRPPERPATEVELIAQQVTDQELSDMEQWQSITDQEIRLTALEGVKHE